MFNGALDREFFSFLYYNEIINMTLVYFI